MTVQSATSTSSTAQAQSGASAASATLMNNYQDFLTLLTAQLTHQDPTQPMDSSQFTQQLVQFSSVEQAIATNKNLEQLVSLSQSSQTANAVSLIGKTVVADGQSTSLANGQADWTYTVPSGATKVTLTVTDSNGKTVFTQAGDATQGSHDVNWSGVETDGSTAPDGQYSLNVAATDANGKAVTTSTAVSGIVSSVETVNGTSMLTIGSRQVPLSAVQSVTDAATASAGSGSNSNSSNTGS